MAVDIGRLRSRRALLTAAAAGVAALAAKALAGAERVLAGAGSEGDAVVIGGEYYDARTMTYVANNTNNNVVLAAQSTGGGTAISGVSDSKYGVIGESTTDVGVFGRSTGSSGVMGRGAYAGVYGQGTGASSVGVYGRSSFYGVLAESETDAAYALFVDGRAVFKMSGIASLAVGSRAKTISAPFDLNGDSQVHTTLDSNQGGLFLHRVTKNTQANTITFTLSANVAGGKYAKVAWIVLH